MISSATPKVLVCTLVALASIFGSANRLEAAPISLSINAPDFLIPIGGKSGVLDIKADGSAVASGNFNALGSQTFSLAGNSTSSGELLLNFHFSGFPLGDPNFIISEAILRLSVYDLDFQTDEITQTVTLKETAKITSAGGEELNLNLKNYLPTSTTPTDDKLVTLKPIQLIPTLLPAGYFEDPFILSIWMNATVKNTSSQKVTLINTPEQVVSTLQMDVKTQGVTTQRVPEPSSLFLLGTGLAIVGSFRTRQRRRSA